LPILVERFVSPPFAVETEHYAIHGPAHMAPPILGKNNSHTSEGITLKLTS